MELEEFILHNDKQTILEYIKTNYRKNCIYELDDITTDLSIAHGHMSKNYINETQHSKRSNVRYYKGLELICNSSNLKQEDKLYKNCKYMITDCNVKKSSKRKMNKEEYYVINDKYYFT